MGAYLQIGSIAKSTITPLNFIDLEESLRLKASAAHFFFPKRPGKFLLLKKDSQAGRNLRPEIMYSPVKIVLFSFQLYIFNHIPQHSHFPYNATGRCSFRMMAIVLSRYSIIVGRSSFIMSFVYFHNVNNVASIIFSTPLRIKSSLFVF